MLTCKKCKSTIVAKQITPHPRADHYVCPVCGTGINNSNIQGVLILLVAVFILWAISFFSYHANAGNLQWNDESQNSVSIALISLFIITIASYRYVKVKTKYNKWFFLGLLAITTLLNEIYSVASKIWGL